MPLSGKLIRNSMIQLKEASFPERRKQTHLFTVFSDRQEHFLFNLLNQYIKRGGGRLCQIQSIQQIWLPLNSFFSSMKLVLCVHRRLGSFLRQILKVHWSAFLSYSLLNVLLISTPLKSSGGGESQHLHLLWVKMSASNRPGSPPHLSTPPPGGSRVFREMKS